MRQLQLTLVFVLWLCLSITPALAGTVASGGGGLGGGGGGSGDASEAEQQAQTAILTTIDADTGTIASGVGAPTDAVATAGGEGSLSAKLRNATALLDTLNTALSTLNAKFPSAATPADNTALGSMTSVFAINGCYDGSTVDLCVKASAGAGNSDSGTQRVVVARDSDVCNPKDTSQAVISTASSGNVELVALTSGQTIYLCDFTIMAGGTVGVQLIYGTGAACATGETNMTGVMPLVVNTGWTHNYGGRLKTAEANAFCIELSGAVQVDGVVTYRKVATL